MYEKVSPQKARAIVNRLLGKEYKLPRIGYEIKLSETVEDYPTSYYLKHEADGYTVWSYTVPRPEWHKEMGIKNKVELYETAYSPLFKKFVKIVKVRYDEFSRPIIDCKMDGKPHIFRYEELTDYCL
jgi:hypothetical protein